MMVTISIELFIWMCGVIGRAATPATFEAIADELHVDISTLLTEMREKRAWVRAQRSK